LILRSQQTIFFSSVKAVADSVEGVLTEDIIPAPKGPYGESKLAAEEYILSYQSQSQSQFPDLEQEIRNKK
jgi:nucleoside-diphosphate-sugar epimerase